MKVGTPFNPYKVFQGIFAPYWLLEHPGLAAGAKLCYIRLLGFAGKDARCYPSLETLGNSLGVSDRQARDYVKELERAGLIAIEQRGLRKTNVYLFIWTAELERLCNSVPEDSDDADDTDGGASANSIPDRNNRSGQDRNQSSAPDRNTCSGLERNRPSGPIGINSGVISSLESSSSSAVARKASVGPKTKMRVKDRHEDLESLVLMNCNEPRREIAEAILHWARERRLKRLTVDRRLGLPDDVSLDEWSEILDGMGIYDHDRISALMDTARVAADRGGEWLSWSFLTLQIQIAAERTRVSRAPQPEDSTLPSMIVEEDPTSDWAKLKAKLRTQVAEIPFMNWFHGTRQVQRCGCNIIVAVPDEPTRAYLEEEYRELIDGATSGTDIEAVRLVVSQPRLDVDPRHLA